MKRKDAKRRKEAGGASRVALRTAHQLQQELEISERTFQRLVQDGLKPARPGRGSAPALYDPVIVAKFIRGATAPGDEDDEDLFSGGSDSVWLERLRKEKAIEAKRRNEVASGRLVEIDDVLKSVDVIFTALRAEFEALERLYGAAVGDAIRQAIARAEVTMKAKLPKPAGNGQAVQGTLAI